MKKFLPILLLTACSGSNLYPSQADMNRTCPEVVSDSYKSLSKYNNRANLSTATTVLITGVSCVISLGTTCVIAGTLGFGVDMVVDPYGKKSAANEFNKNMRQGRDMKCTED